MKNKILILFFILLTGAVSAHDLKGTIVDESNIPVEGVSIINQTTGGYAFTNVSGYFELDDISVGDVIMINSLGFQNQKLTIDENQLDATIKIVLLQEAVSLDQVTLVSKVDALTKLVNVDVRVNPVKSSQEVMRKVPGLIIGQHAGGGKAEQIFLRGFDVDHGTDVAINVDGLPVNLPSHAHGQGYADLHFLIPETIDNIDFGKGPYYANKGNFNTAGYIDLNIKDKIDNSSITVEAGQFNTLRAVGLLKVSEGEYSNAYIASEAVLTDGFFDASQNFNRFNIMGRYNYNNYEDEELTLSVSHFQSRWDASGQIPQRAVEQRLITRFGAIDSTEGGNTSRSNIWLKHMKQLDEHQRIKTTAYLSKYDFELFSNFTFFLNNPTDGDQIQQVESRTILGAETVYDVNFHNEDHNAQLSLESGLGFRYDDNNDVQLSRTRNRREILERLAFGDVDEFNGYGFASLTYKTKKWSLVPGVRLDYFKFGHNDFLQPTFTNRQEGDVIVSPKFNAIYTPNQNFQFYLKSGFGFHSNDSRVVNDPTATEDTLPSAFGVDIGTVFKPADRVVISGALWGLGLQQEFVYVGDEAVVEPSGKSRRYGVDFGIRYQLTDWLFANADVNYTLARSIEEPDGEDFIPLAPDLTSTGGLTVRNLGKFSGGINYRYVDDRPANEDNSIVAIGYFVTDMNINYNFNKNWSAGIIIENLFDTEWNETQFATETRLFNEAEPVEEITFTPGTPFFLRGRLSVNF
ncbi:TonB-dependent receptor [Maribacter sp. 2210JD10-5]|uniref:TonB-dependent receptor n=1 Tax=Maribacter sp. 2210JD10-5 TaxID=3386272 RepID=UPI0039BD0BD8